MECSTSRHKSWEGNLSLETFPICRRASKKAPIQRYADKVSSVFVPFILVFATLTFLAWAFFNSDPDSLNDALSKMIAVLVIACPCA